MSAKSTTEPTEVQTIQRWKFDTDDVRWVAMAPNSEGAWVTHEDHLAAIAAERERCAGIVQEHLDMLLLVPKSSAQAKWEVEDLETLLSAIREGK